MKSVLFVCLGNICRSPMAEAVMKKKVHEHGLEVVVDSAGTGNWHIGHDPDPRTIRTLANHKIFDYSKARQFKATDFDQFDLIIAMDADNKRVLEKWENANLEKLSLMMDWSPGESGTSVPDPYYGEFEDFELVFRMVDRATDGIINKINPL